MIAVVLYVGFVRCYIKGALVPRMEVKGQSGDKIVSLIPSFLIFSGPLSCGFFQCIEVYFKLGLVYGRS